MVTSLYNVGNPREAPLTGSLAAQCYSQMGTARLRALTGQECQEGQKSLLDSGLLNHQCQGIYSITPKVHAWCLMESCGQLPIYQTDILNQPWAQVLLCFPLPLEVRHRPWD